MLGERFRQADLRGFHRVIRHAAARLAAEDRRDDDDGAAVLVAQVRHGRARHPDRREQGLVQRLLPVGVGGALEVGALAEPHVVDDHIEAPELRDRRIDHARYAGVGRHVGGNAGDAGSGRGQGLDFLCRFLQLLFPARADHDMCAFGDQRLGRRQSETATPAGDDRNLTCQS